MGIKSGNDIIVKNFSLDNDNNKVQLISYDLSDRKSINRWILSELYEKHYISPLDTMDYMDFDKTGVNPNRLYSCRKHFLKDENIKNIELSKPRYTTYYFPYENEKVEFSGFWHLPTHIARYAKTYIWVEEAGLYRFRVTTCGRVILNCNGQEALSFSPYHRNVEHKKDVELQLKQGRNEIIVYFDDLAERDTTYFFRLYALDDVNMKIQLFIEENTNINDVLEMEKLMENVSFEKDQITKGEIKLKFDYPSPIAFKLKIDSQEDIIEKLPPISLEKQVNVGDKDISLGDVSNYALGFYHFLFIGKINNVNVERKGMLEIYPENIIPSTPSTIHERKNLALKFIAEHGELIMQKAFAMTELEENLDEAEKIIRHELVKIKGKYDCADFSLAALLSMWIKYRDKNIYSEELWNDIKDIILDFRFWCDELGNDVMWFFSENHALIFYTCQLLSGQLFKDEIFKRSGKTGAEQIEIAKGRIADWFDYFLKNGFSEWNSTTYIPIDMIAFFALYDYADDEKIKEMAKKALDYTFDLLTINSHHGQMATTSGRTYDKSLKRVRGNEVAFLNWILFGVGYMNQSTRASVPLILSAYEYTNEKAPDLVSYTSRKKLIYQTTQGNDGEVTLNICKTNDYILSSSNDYKKYQPGYQENVVHALIGPNPEAQIFINHPGESSPIGFQRPSYWAGNGVLPSIKQYKNIAFMHFDVDEGHLVDFTHAYFPVHAFDEITAAGNWYFGKSGDGYIGIYARNGLRLSTKGINEKRELISEGKENAWIIKVGSKHEFSSYENFVKQYSKASIKSKNEVIEIEDSEYGHFKFGTNDQFTLDGQDINIKLSGSQERIEYE